MAEREEERIGFEHYVTREEIRRKLEEGKKEKIVIEPRDTKHTLKRKRNNGCCEYAGCTNKENLGNLLGDFKDRYIILHV
jgi:hypothetical protein